MKKIKKILAMVMAMAMIMGLGMTANAAEELPQTASITINKLTPNDKTTVKIYQVVSHNAQNSEWVAADWAQDYVKFPTQASAADINWAGLKEKVETDGITPTAEKTGINETNLVELGRVVQHNHHSIYVDYIVITDWDKSNITLQQGETQDYKWVDKDTLKNMKSNEKERSRVRDYQQGQSIKNSIKRYEITRKKYK